MSEKEEKEETKEESKEEKKDKKEEEKKKKEEKKKEDEVPLIDIDCFMGPVTSGSSAQDRVQWALTATSMKRQQKEIFEAAVLHDGVMEKQCGTWFGKQKRYFKIIASGNYLVYYKERPDQKASIEPLGVYKVVDMEDIEHNGSKGLSFKIGHDTFTFFCKSNEAANVWITYLKFLNQMLLKLVGSGQMRDLAESYFSKLPTYTKIVDDQRNRDVPDQIVMTQQGDEHKGTVAQGSDDDEMSHNLSSEDEERDNGPSFKRAQTVALDVATAEDVKDKKKSGGSNDHSSDHKFVNICKDTYAALYHENPAIRVGIMKQNIKNPTNEQKHTIHSLRALHFKGIWGYIKNIPRPKLQCRFICGFLRKRSSSQLKHFMVRWWFLISSRPINCQDFLHDDLVLKESDLPPLLEFDTMYQFFMGNGNDSSSHSQLFKTQDIKKIVIKNMKKCTESGHSFILDTGDQRFYLNTKFRFEMERWIESICISMQTSREAKLSLTGKIKNISLQVAEYDMDQQMYLSKVETDNYKQLPLEVQAWEGDSEELVTCCGKVKTEMIEIFDSCLALQPQRRDIISSYMDLTHLHILQVQSNFWEAIGISLSPFETLGIVDWNNQYLNALATYGIREDSLTNGVEQLANAYARKIHSQITPLFIGIIQTDADHATAWEADHKGLVFTNFPDSVMRLYFEAFKIVRVKKIKQLILKMLKVYFDITQQIQDCQDVFFTKNLKEFSIEYLIAQCNNFYKFWQLFQDLIGPLIEEEICTDAEIQQEYNERAVIAKFNKFKEMMIGEITDRIFRVNMEQWNENRAIDSYFFKKNFIDIDMNIIVNQAFLSFQMLTDMMEEKTKRTAWEFFLERTVMCYIQCLLLTSSKVSKKQAVGAVEKIKEDHHAIQRSFEPEMTLRALNSGLEVLEDFLSFFECSAQFMSMPCEKLRKSQGKAFTFKIVQSLVSLRVDLASNEQKEALKICKDIIENFKDELVADQKGKKSLLGAVEENTVKEKDGSDDEQEEEKQQESSSEGDVDFDMDAFLDEGGKADEDTYIHIYITVYQQKTNQNSI